MRVEWPSNTWETPEDDCSRTDAGWGLRRSRHNSAYAYGTAVNYRLTADNAAAGGALHLTASAPACFDTTASVFPGDPGPANASTNAFGRVAQSNIGKIILKPALQPVDQLGSSGR